MATWTPHTKQELINAGADFSDDGMPVKIIYPQANDPLTGAAGVTTSSKQGVNQSLADQGIKANSDGLAGQTINIQTGNSAEGLKSLSGVLSSGFDDLFSLIQKNTDKNNAWSASQAQKQMDFQERMNQIAQEFNAGEAAKNRDWQMMMSNTAHQREVQDLKAAGLNPVLSASGGNGAAVTSGATAAGVSPPSGAKGDTDESMNMALTSLYGALISAQTQMYNANLSARTNLQLGEMQKEAQMYGAKLANEASKYGAEMSAEASRYASGNNYAAQVYSANKNFENSEAQRQWNSDHPSNAYQAASAMFGNEGISGAKQQSKNWIQRGLNFIGDVVLGR